MFDKQLINKIAELSMLCFTEEETLNMVSDLNNIAVLTDKIRDFNSDSQPITPQPLGISDLRYDSPCNSYTQAEITKNAKSTSNGCFTVPKIV